MFVGIWVPHLNWKSSVLTMYWLPSVITAVSEDAGAVSARENCELVFLPGSVKQRIHLHHTCWWRILLLLNTEGLGSYELLHKFFYILIEVLNLLPKYFSSTEKAHLPSGLNNSLDLQAYAQLYFWETSLLLTYQAMAYKQRVGQLW